MIDNGFFYDFAFERQFTPEDLANDRGRKMQKIVKAAPGLAHRDVARRGRSVFPRHGRGIQGSRSSKDSASEATVAVLRKASSPTCAAVRTCRTQTAARFKLMKVAGAYWRGDSNNAMLSRIYGTAWSNDKDRRLPDQLEEAEKRDHRKIGKALDLFHLQEEAPGLVFWHPKGWRSGRWSSSTCARSTATAATGKCVARRSSMFRCGRTPATGTTTRTTCSSPSPRSGPTR